VKYIVHRNYYQPAARSLLCLRSQPILPFVEKTHPFVETGFYLENPRCIFDPSKGLSNIQTEKPNQN